MLETVFLFIYLISTFIPLDVDKFGAQALVSGNFFLPRYYIYYLGKKKLPETSACGLGIVFIYFYLSLKKSRLFLGVERIKTSHKKQSRN